MKDKNLLERCQRIADLYSQDPSTKCGALIYDPGAKTILTEGWNTTPYGVDVLDRLNHRPDKYDWVLHSEAMALADAARQGSPTAGCWIYLNWHVSCCCSNCAKLIIQCGITRFVGTTRTGHISDYPVEIVSTMFSEAGVELVKIDIRD